MTEDRNTPVEVVVTGPTDQTLNRIAHELVEHRLIACANVFEAAVTRTFRWAGKFVTEPEKRLLLHTGDDVFDEVVAFVKERHPYDVPNVTALPLIAGNADYFAWLAAETRD